MPALANSESTFPWRRSVLAMAASIWASSPISHRSHVASTPRAESSATAFSLRSSLRAQIATDAPAWATPLARPRPIPVFPPVTTTTRPVRSSIAPTLPPTLDVEGGELVDEHAEVLPRRRREHERQPRHAEVAQLLDLIGEGGEVGLLAVVQAQPKGDEAHVERLRPTGFVGSRLGLGH